MDKLLALLAFTVFTGFLAILVIWVPRWDLGIVCGLTLAMVAVDFYGSLFRK
jgi:hypothetical protein